MMIKVINDKNCPKHLITATSIIIYPFPANDEWNKVNLYITNYEKYEKLYFLFHIFTQRVKVLLRWKIEKEEDSLK